MLGVGGMEPGQDGEGGGGHSKVHNAITWGGRE